MGNIIPLAFTPPPPPPHILMFSYFQNLQQVFFYYFRHKRICSTGVSKTGVLESERTNSQKPSSFLFASFFLCPFFFFFFLLNLPFQFSLNPDNTFFPTNVLVLVVIDNVLGHPNPSENNNLFNSRLLGHLSCGDDCLSEDYFKCQTLSSYLLLQMP